MKFRSLKFKRLLFLFCVIVLTALIITVPALALEFNGISGSSGGGGTASKEYAVNTNGTALIGFRFSLVNSSNIQSGSSVDVISNDNYNYYTQYNKFDYDYKRCKTYWVENYTKVSSISTSVNNTHFYDGSSLGFEFDLPKISGSADINNLSSKLDAWQEDADNIDVILSLIGSDMVEDTSQIGAYKIVIEPLFSVALTGGSDHVLTMTELAVYGGGFEYNNNFDTVPSTSSTSGSWGYIANYTNRHFPNYMRTETADCNWDAAPMPDNRLSFANIITKGYGANVLSATSMGVITNTTNLVYVLNGGTVTANADGYGDNGWGSITYNGTAFFHHISYGNKDKPINASSFGLVKEGYTFAGWQVLSTGQILDPATDYDSTVYAQYDDASKTTANTQDVQCHLYAVWEPNTTNLIYVLNGGTVTANADGYGDNGWGSITYNGTALFHHISYGNKDKPINASSFGLVKEGYTFTGWKVLSTGQVLDQDTDYDSTVYAQYDDASKTTANTQDVQCHLYAVWEPNTIKLTLDANGGYGGTSEVYFKYGINAFYTDRACTNQVSTISIPTLAGHSYVRYTGDGTSGGDSGEQYIYTDGTFASDLCTDIYKDATLTAQWTISDSDSVFIDIDYVGNGATEGENWTEVFDLSGNESYTLSEKSGAFVRVETNADTGVNTLFSLKGWEIAGKIYSFGEDIPSETLAILAETKSGRTNPVVTVYAYWDEYPVIDAVNRWFSLDDARNDVITIEELMKTSSAADGDVGDKTNFSNGEGSFEFINFDAEEFKRFTTTGSVTVTCLAIDKAGNETYRTITIHIVDKSAASFASKTRFTRFVGEKYYKNSDGIYVAENAGGLNPGSVWINVSEYEQKLSKTLSNKQDKDTGAWDMVYQTWTFTIEQISEVKAYIEEHGLGNTRESDALAKFYALYVPK